MILTDHGIHLRVNHRALLARNGFTPADPPFAGAGPSSFPRKRESSPGPQLAKTVAELMVAEERVREGVTGLVTGLNEGERRQA
ncbi:MAG: hypothetical protein M1330_02060 [Armatimonadetes bacterium]|nr:hypothetical protein [Armatimonadota bacterium]